MGTVEFSLAGAFVAGICLFLYFIFKGKVEDDQKDKNFYTPELLTKEAKDILDEEINRDLDSLRLNSRDLESRREIKRTLSKAARGCAHGNINLKRIITSQLKKIISSQIGITEEMINNIIPFDQPELLSALDKFEILLYLQIRKNNYKMFKTIADKTGLDRLKKDGLGYYYDLLPEDIDKAYHEMFEPLSFDDRLNILTQRTYELAYGLSYVDLMVMEDESIDSIIGGVSGTTTDNVKYREEDVFFGDFTHREYKKKKRTFESIWIVYDGKPIHMKFLSFEKESEIIRVTKNLSEYGRPGHFTSGEGGSKNRLYDGSRVVTWRPQNSSQWAFFIRKFGSTSDFDLEKLITDMGCEYPIELIKWLIKGNVNVVYSGDQSSGKTTNVRASVKEIDRRQQIRTIEADFELYLNDAYVDKSILGTRPSKSLGFPKLIELLKASEAHTILFGETASLEHARHLFDLLLAGTKRVLTTGHWPTADDLISYFVLAQGGYGASGTEDIERLISRLLNIDIHHVKDNNGHRYIDRITEIIPVAEPVFVSSCKGLEGQLEKIAFFLEKIARKKTYTTQDIIVFENGQYILKHTISDTLAKFIFRNIPPDEINAFMKSGFINCNSIKESGDLNLANNFS